MHRYLNGTMYAVCLPNRRVQPGRAKSCAPFKLERWAVTTLTSQFALGETM